MFTNDYKVEIGFKKLEEDAVLPSYAHESDSGMDIRSIEDGKVPPYSFHLFRTGLAPVIPYGLELQVRPRSGLQCKKGIIAGFGTIDSGYTGDIGIVLYNITDTAFEVKKGDRIAQLVLAPVVRGVISEHKEVKESDRGDSGFGSTGLN